MSLEHAPARQGHLHQRPHLFTEELAERWGVNTTTISRTYQKLGLTPAKLGKRLLFSLTQIEAVEKQNMK